MEKERYVLIDEIAESPFDHDEADLIVDTDIKNVYGANNCGDLCDLLNQQDARIKELEKENQQLKQQLEEKDKVIEMQKSIQRYDIGDMLVENTKLKQSQKEHVINVLENIMSLCRNGISDYYSLKYVYTIIDNQIKELRSEK